MAKGGSLHLRQEVIFGPILVRGGVGARADEDARENGEGEE
jgi:hypothetical protein